MTTPKFDRVKFNYFSLGAGFCTIAYQVDSNRDAPTRVVKFGVSYCSPKDSFIKNDTYKKVMTPIPRAANKRPLVNGKPLENKDIPAFLANRKVETVLDREGGRTLALKRLEQNPTILKVEVPKDERPTQALIAAMQDFAVRFAPKWKNHVVMTKLRKNVYHVLRGERSLMIKIVEDEDSDYLLEVLADDSDEIFAI